MHLVMELANLACEQGEWKERERGRGKRGLQEWSRFSISK